MPDDVTGRPADVLVIGAGPVGLATALLTARRGWRVTVLERHPGPYPQPRAVHFDDEVARLLADAGLAAELARLTEPADIYEWRNGKDQTLLRFDWTGAGPSGWPFASMFNQPALEAALAEAADRAGPVTVLRGFEAVELSQGDGGVEVVARDRDGGRHRFTAGWAIGCDGANSFVRDHMRTDVTDLGFFYDWLIVDVVPHESRSWNPVNLQICDPRRPTTVVSGGPGRRRWEFMRMPGETVEELNNEETAWRLLAPWKLTPDNSALERHAIYTFQARWADRWRDGRLLLAGDSAHLMPPFAGQGMCSGIRDAANLSWKLDLVLRGLAGPGLLDSYGPERSAHVQHAIGLSVELGKVICVTDPEQAAGRDAFMIGQDGDPARILPPLPPPTLTEGIIYREPDGAPAPGAGLLTGQPTVAHRGQTALLDDVTGLGFVLAYTEDPSAPDDPGALLGDERRAFLDAIGARVLSVSPGPATAEIAVASGPAIAGEKAARADAVPAGPAGTENAQDVDRIVDVDGRLIAQLAVAGHVAALVRPDHYLFGGVTTLGQLPGLVDDLRRQLTGGTLA